QEFAKVLGIKEKITSPTFVIQKNYKLRSKNRKFLIHIDTYRIKDPKEILDLGWKELIKDPKNIILVEWAEKIKKILPKKYIQINFEHLGENKRKITVLR
ncbi:MAG TPA: tRNA (adenosine(37)-N6)-threonylcarbamoyltransferase complex ATPase subunit type 1 TsaE, partial [bacterium]|nr:tRNA (adenosine(37)-N6)-threonylcarbamoyltransferase complex ATPase subunit type 1 TsaE [bacterium]